MGLTLVPEHYKFTKVPRTFEGVCPDARFRTGISSFASSS